MLYHTTLFQFPDGTSQEVIDGVLEAHRELGQIPAVLGIAVGKNLMPDVVAGPWKHGMTMTFESQETMMGEFVEHPLHQKVLKEQTPLFSAVLAMDVVSDPA